MTTRPTAPRPPQHELDRILRAQDWASLRKRLFCIAFAVTQSRSLSEELADMVIVDCCDPSANPWNPASEPDLVPHALRRLRDRWSAERRKLRVRQDARNIATVRELGQPPATPDEILNDAASQARSDRVIAAARERLSCEVDRRLLDISLDGVHKPAEQAARLSLPIQDVRLARMRIQYALRTAIDEEESPWTHANVRPTIS
jgi:hypothetical protein